MSVYNGGEYLPESIESILQQTYRNLELIIIDDGSTDNSLKIIKSKQDPRIRIISRENKGLVVSLNEGLNLAKGEYVARMDADDISVSTRLSRQVDYMKAHPNCAVVGTYIKEIDERGKPFKRSVLSNGVIDQCLEFALPRYNPLAHGSIMMRRKIALRAGGYNEEFWPAEDYELWARLTLYGRLGVIPEELYIYRVNSQGISFSNEELQAQKVKYIQSSLISHPPKLLDGEKYGVMSIDKRFLVKKYIKKLKFVRLLNLYATVQEKTNSRKNICIYTNALTVGGGEVYIQQVTSALKDRVDFTVLAPASLIQKLDLDNGIAVRPFPNWVARSSFRGSYKIRRIFMAFILLRMGIKAFDAFHINQLDGLIIRSIHNKTKIIFTAHSRLNHVASDREYLKKLLKDVNSIVYVANAIAPDLRNLDVDSSKLNFIPNGINGDSLMKLGQKRTRHTIVWSGRVDKADKNPDLFVDIASLAQDKNLKYSFTIYGDGPSSQHIQHRIRTEDLKNIRLAGFEADQRKIYEDALVLCLTSDSEAMPLNIIEAFAAAVPVVATDVGDVGKMVKAAQGSRVTVSNAEKILEIIQQTVESDSYGAYCKSAREAFVGAYQVNTMADNLEKIYRDKS